MKAYLTCEATGSFTLSLHPESTEEMEAMTNVVMYGGTKDKENSDDDTPETFAFKAASAYGESDTTIYAVASERDGAVMTHDGQRPAIEVRLWRK